MPEKLTYIELEEKIQKLETIILEGKKSEKKLRESKNVNDLLLDSLPHSAMLINTNRKILKINKAAAEIGVEIGEYCWDTFGKCEHLSKENLQKIKDNPECSKDGISCTFCLADHLMKTGTPQNYPEKLAFGKIWDTWWVLVSENVFLHYSIDITERKKSEELLLNTRLQLETIINNIDLSVYITEMNSYKILFMNNHMKKLFGEDLTGGICWKILNDNSAGPCSPCHRSKLIDTDGKPKEPQIIECYNNRLNKWWELHILAIPWVDSNFVQMKIAIDINDKKLFELRLKDSNKKFLKIMNGLDAMVFVADIEAKEMLFINQYAINKFGEHAEEKCWKYLLNNQKSPCSFCNTEKLMKENIDLENMIVREYHNTIDGKWYYGKYLCIKWVDNRIVHLHFAMDMTKNRQTQQDLKIMVDEQTVFLNDEISHRKKTEKKLEQKTKYLKQANLALKSMLDNRDAEIRAVEENIFLNIKNYISPYLKEIKKNKPSEEILTYLNIINTSINKLMLPMAETHTAKFSDFTPMEIKVADLVKEGMRTKDICKFLHIAQSSVATYRNNIRKKLGICNTKTNLRVFLNLTKF